jgi:hypothetical protein
MSKVSKNQTRGAKKELDVKGPLAPRNYTGNTISSWCQVWADSPEEAEQKLRKELECPKGDINITYVGN